MSSNYSVNLFAIAGYHDYGWASPLALTFLKITSYRGGVRSIMLQVVPVLLHLDKKLGLQWCAAPP